MAARSIERCKICNLPLTATGQCLSCDKVQDLRSKNQVSVPPAKKDDRQTAENKPVEGQVLQLRKQKKSLRRAFLFNQTTAERREVSEAVTRIGRDRSNSIPLPDDPYVSRHHAWILQAKEGFWIEDLGSTNTTLLNGQPVKERSQIIAGDKLTFGKTELIFFAEK
jgi:pSer/pThr/pTyr-binding forkhead associated (FHA) protein